MSLYEKETSRGRQMEIHTYQIKALLKKNGLPILKGGIAYTPEEAYDIADKLKADRFSITAQVFCPDREKGVLTENPTGPVTGIMSANAPDAVKKIAENMLGKTLILPDCPTCGYDIQKIYIEEQCPVVNQVSLSFFIDRPTQGIVCAVQLPNHPLEKYQLSKLEITAGDITKIMRLIPWAGSYKKDVAHLMRQIYAVFLKYNALALEINPLILSDTGHFYIQDARLIFDSDTLFRFPEIAALAEVKPGLEREAIAHLSNFRYTKLSGNIACLVNGAGLGLATIDLIQSQGGQVACLLDVGTEPSKESVSKAFKLALSEPDIDGILVNIFGGITRCDTIAQGLISASNEISVGLPLVVRMDGTNSKIGMRLLFESHLPFNVIQSMPQAVETIIQKTREIF